MAPPRDRVREWLAIAALSSALHAGSALLAGDRASPTFDPLLGLLLAAWIRRPLGRWAEIALAVLAGEAAFATLALGRPTLGAAQAIPFALAASAAAALWLRWLARDGLGLGRVRDVWAFVGVAGLATASAALGNAALSSPDFASGRLAFRDAWVAGFLGTLIVAPALLVARDARLRGTLGSWRARVELAAVACAIVGATYLTYFASSPFPLPRGVPALLMVWTSFRFRPRGAALALPVMAITVLLAVAAGELAEIPSLGTGPATAAWEIEAFLSLSFVTSLLLAALSEERAQLIEHLEREVNVLRGLLPICAHCKKIRDGENRWHPIEGYIQSHSEATFTHGICPACEETHYGELLRRAK